MKLQHKMTMAITGLVTALILALSILFFINWYASIQRQVALDAMDQAMIISENPAIQANIALENGYIAVSQAVSDITLKTQIQYLYIINRAGRYYAHPLPQRLNTEADAGAVHVKLTGSAPDFYFDPIHSAVVEGYAPIYTEGIQTGGVVVGIYNGRILQTLKSSIKLPLFFIAFSMLAGSLIAYWLSRNIKSSIYGLEPEAIGLLLNQRQKILENLGEGLIALDKNRQIVLINHRAQELMGAPNLVEGQGIMGTRLEEIVPEVDALRMLPAEREWRIESGVVLKVEMMSIQDINDKLSFLIKLEDMSAVRRRAEELTNLTQISQALRAQNHEFMNKLHTISGLIQLEHFEDAVQYIEAVSANRQQMTKSISEKIKVPSISGLLLGKYSKAIEEKVDLSIRPTAFIERLPNRAFDEDITSILGNLIDNAVDAVQGNEDAKVVVDIFEACDQLNLIVEDNGAGVPEALLEQIMVMGYTTKGTGHGFGLAIVIDKIHALKGDV